MVLEAVREIAEIERRVGQAVNQTERLLQERSRHMEELRRSLHACELQTNQYERIETMQHSLEHQRTMIVVISTVSALIVITLLILAFSIFVAWGKERRRVEAQAATHRGSIEGRDDRIREMERKLSEYFSAGSRLVWYIYPDSRTVHVFTSPTSHVELDENQTLGGGDVLPGFELPLSRLFQPPKAN